MILQAILSYCVWDGAYFKVIEFYVQLTLRKSVLINNINKEICSDN